MGNLAQGETRVETKMDFASQNLTAGQLNAIVKNLGGEEGALKFLRGEFVVQPLFVIVPELLPEPVLDFLIRVDRSVDPKYPSSFKKFENTELECLGPVEYDLQTDVEEWLYHDQKHCSVEGNIIYKHLKDTNTLASCLNLQDGLAIQQKGIAVFQKLFAGKAVFLWGSVVQRGSENLRVPCLVEDNNKVVVHWAWLASNCDPGDPALRFTRRTG